MIDQSDRITLDNIDLLEDTWARERPPRPVRGAAPGGAGLLARASQRQGLLGDHEARRREGDQQGRRDVLDRARLGVHPRPGPAGPRVPPHDAAADGPAEAQPLPPAGVGRLHAPHDHDADRLDRAAGPARSSRSVDGRGEIEFTLDIAAELPMQAICEMIGIAEEDRHRATALAQPPRRRAGPGLPVTPRKTAQLASAELYALCDELAADRRQQPARRHHVGPRQRRGRRRPADRHRAQPVLRAPRRRRQRDDPQPDRPRDARADRAARRRAPSSSPNIDDDDAVGHGRRGDAPVGRVDPELPPHRHAGHRDPRRADQGRATRS